MSNADLYRYLYNSVLMEKTKLTLRYTQRLSLRPTLSPSEGVHAVF